MAIQQLRGRQGEGIAAQYLLERGYRVLERNWRSHHREIDLIATRDGQVVFVEVKCRSPRSWTEPWEAVGKAKQRRLIAAAHAYVMQHHLDGEVRFDIISVILGDPVQLDHMEYAFYPLLR